MHGFRSFEWPAVQIWIFRTNSNKRTKSTSYCKHWYNCPKIVHVGLHSVGTYHKKFGGQNVKNKNMLCRVFIEGTRLGLGNRYNRFFRFGFFGVVEVRFTDRADRSMCLTKENRVIRFSVFRFGVRFKLNIRNPSQSTGGCHFHLVAAANKHCSYSSKQQAAVAAANVEASSRIAGISRRTSMHR
jgi:hypothetical protein